MGEGEREWYVHSYMPFIWLRVLKSILCHGVCYSDIKKQKEHPIIKDAVALN